MDTMPEPPAGSLSVSMTLQARCQACFPPSPSRQNPGVSAVAAPDRRASPEERLGGLPSACLHVKKRFPCGNVCFCSPGFLNSLISLNIFLASGNWPCHEYDNNVFGDWKKLFCFPATGKKIWEVADRNAWTQIPAHT